MPEGEVIAALGITAAGELEADPLDVLAGGVMARAAELMSADPFTAVFAHAHGREAH